MIELTQRGRVAILTLRHGKANALDSELCNGIIERFGQLRTSADAIVLTGQERILFRRRRSHARSPAGPPICASSCR